MRLALISDIHGNLVALDAVLADVRRAGVSDVVCLGDVADSGPQPCECIARLRDFGIPCVLGNTDEELVTRQLEPLDQHPDGAKITAISRWCAEQLSTEDLATLTTYQPTTSRDLGGTTLLCFHGSPRSNHEQIRASTSDDALDDIFAGYDATVFAGGHTHAQLLRRWRDALVVNPGSVGLPFYKGRDGRLHNPPFAEYAIVSVEDGSLGVDLRRVAVDIDAVKRAAFTSGMPYAGWWTASWDELN